MTTPQSGHHLGERVVAFVLRRRWALLVLLALCTLAALAGASRVGIDNAVEVWFVDDDPTLLAYREFQRTFGNDEVVVMGVSRTDGGTMLDARGLALLEEVGRRAEAVEGINQVRSVVTLPAVRGDSATLDIGPVIDGSALTEEEASVTRAAILDDPMLRRLVGPGEHMALVLGQMDAMDDIDARRDGILARLRASLASVDGSLAFAGIGVIYAALNDASTRGAGVFILASYLLVAGLMWWLYGRLVPMLVTLGVVGLGSVWVMGLYGAAGRDINMVTMVMPTLVLVIGVSDCVHMLSHVAAQDPALPRWERVRRGMGFVFWPCLFNTLTTSMGFLSLTTSAMPVVRDLGWFSAVGLLAAFVLALVICSVAALSPRAEPALAEGGLVQRGVDGLADLAVRWPRRVLVGAAFVGLVAALGITRIVADTYSIDFLHHSHPVRQDSDRIEAAFGPYTPVELVVHSEAGVRDPATLSAIAAWQDAIEAERCGDASCVGWTRSPADVVRRLHQVLSADGAYVVPADPAALDQLMFLYESDPDGDLDRFISADGTRARLTVGVPMASARGFGERIAHLESLARLPAGAEVDPAGYLPLYVRIMDYIVSSQLTSFGLAFLVIFTLIGLLFRSVRFAALAVPANLLPVMLTLGVMGLAGIRLDVATVTIAAIVLGLVVDDTVQFLYRYRHELESTDDVTLAVRRSIRRVGRPMAVTSLVLGLGFLVLVLASVKSVAWFGLLLAVAMGSALLADLLVVPAMLVVLQVRRT